MAPAGRMKGARYYWTFSHSESIMQALATLGTLMGLAFTSGIRLYSTVFAVGLGYRTEEFTVMGVKPGERVARFTEALDVVKRLWTEEKVTHHGTYFEVPGVGASIRPKRQPRPPIWIGNPA